MLLCPINSFVDSTLYALYLRIPSNLNPKISKHLEEGETWPPFCIHIGSNLGIAIYNAFPKFRILYSIEILAKPNLIPFVFVTLL